MALRLVRFTHNLRALSQIRCMSDSQQPGWGSGAGKGGGAGGAVREAGGGFGKMEAAHEEMYFKKMQAKQLKELKESIHDEIKYHKDQIEEHEEAIERHNKKMKKLHKMSQEDD